MVNKEIKFTLYELAMLLKCVRLTEIDFGECPDLDNIKFKLQYLIDKYSAE